MDNYLNATRDQIFSLIPYCAKLSDESERVCLMLDGNKNEAAEVTNIAVTIRASGCATDEPSKSLLAILAPGAVLHVYGQVDVSGAGAFAAAWQRFSCREGVFGSNLAAVDAEQDSVRVVGYLDMSRPKLDSKSADSTYLAARSVQVWKRDGTGKFVLNSWTVGEFKEGLKL